MGTGIVVGKTGVLTLDQYSVVFRQTPPPELPDPEEMFSRQVDHFLRHGIGTEAEYKALRPFVPDALDFVLRPAQPDPLNLDISLSKIVVLDGKQGRSTIFSDEVADEVPVPMAAHLMLGVADGHARDSGFPQNSRNDIMAEGRGVWNCWDGICYVSLFSGALSGRAIYLAASRCGKLWPYLCVRDGHPTLSTYFTSASVKWGMASCRQRVGPGLEE
jgi:hypothetical protein